MILRLLKRKLGFVRLEKERGLLFMGDDCAAFERSGRLIEAVTGGGSRLSIILSSVDPDVLEWLEKKYPDARVLPRPFSNRLSVWLFLRRLNVRVAVILERARENRALTSGCKRRAIAVVALSAADLESSATADMLLELLGRDLKALRKSVTVVIEREE